MLKWQANIKFYSVAESHAMIRVNDKHDTPPGGIGSRHGSTVGVEIGYDTIYMVRLGSVSDGAIRSDIYREFKYDQKLALGDAEFAAALKKALNEFCGPSSEVEIWSAPKSEQGRVCSVNTPPVGASRLHGAVQWALHRKEPYLEKETLVDFQIEDEGKLDANQNLRITGVLFSREDVVEIKEAFSRAGYPLAGLTVPLLAFCNLVSLSDEHQKDSAVLICCTGYYATSLSVLRYGRLVFSRSVPIGLKVMAEAVVKEFDSTLSLDAAIQLVSRCGHQSGNLDSDDILLEEKINTLLGPIRERLTGQIERTLEYHTSNYDTNPVEKIYFGGDIGVKTGLFESISRQLALPVSILDPLGPQIEADPIGRDTSESVTSFAAAYGIALEGGKAGVNLAYTRLDRQNNEKRSRAVKYGFGGLALAVSLTVFFFVLQQSHLNALRAERDELNRALGASAPILTEAIIDESIEEASAFHGRRKTLTRRYATLAALTEIAGLTPESISLVHISSEARERFSGGLEPVDRKLLLKGVVTGERTSLETTLTVYVARLNQSPLFGSVEVDSLRLVDGEEGLHLLFALKANDERAGEEIVAER